MTASGVRETIREYLVRATRFPELSDDQNIFADELVSSVFAVELVAFVEQQFDISVEDEDLDIDNFHSVDALSRFVASKSAAA